VVRTIRDKTSRNVSEARQWLRDAVSTLLAIRDPARCRPAEAVEIAQSQHTSGIHCKMGERKVRVTMRARFTIASLAIVFLGLCGVASATTIYDDFLDPGATGQIDHTLWSIAGGNGAWPTAAGSNANFTASAQGAGGSNWNQVRSTTTWDSNTTKFEYKLTSVAGNEDGCYLGVNDSLANGFWIEYRYGAWQTEISDTAQDVRSVTFAAPQPGDILGITRTGNVFSATVNGVVVSSQTAIGAIEDNVKFWLAAARDGTNGNGSARMSVDYVGTTSTVPEPSTLMLLGVGLVSLLAYAWRKRR
jgi:hypothetical protein